MKIFSKATSRRMCDRLCRAGIVLACMLVVGCGGDGVTRVGVQGTVTLNGKPLSTGAIRFQPVGGGLAAGAAIEDGSFTIGAAEGPSPGMFDVEIVSYQPTGEMIPDPDLPGKTTEKMKQVIPARYNTETTLEVELTVSSHKAHEFPLTSP